MFKTSSRFDSARPTRLLRYECEVVDIHSINCYHVTNCHTRRRWNGTWWRLCSESGLVGADERSRGVWFRRLMRRVQSEVGVCGCSRYRTIGLMHGPGTRRNRLCGLREVGWYREDDSPQLGRVFFVCQGQKRHAPCQGMHLRVVHAASRLTTEE